jgi:hypothetical protein
VKISETKRSDGKTIREGEIVVIERLEMAHSAKVTAIRENTRGLTLVFAESEQEPGLTLTADPDQCILISDWSRQVAKIWTAWRAEEARRDVAAHEASLTDEMREDDTIIAAYGVEVLDLIQRRERHPERSAELNEEIRRITGRSTYRP